MTQYQRRAGITIREYELVIQLKNIFRGVKWPGPVLVHGQMGHGLVGKEFRIALQFQKSPDAGRPVQFLK